MPGNYRILVFGDRGAALPDEVVEAIARTAQEFDLHIGDELQIVSGHGATNEPVASVAVFMGGTPAPPFDAPWISRAGIPIVPIVADISNVSAQLPANLAHLNATSWKRKGGADAIASAIMELLRLLPEQRRVFVSYVRAEATQVALQLFAELESRQFQVFVDTHDVRPGASFQARLWHRLCESDVMVMLDTKSYFQRRWTREEFGKANLKKAAILRVALPDAAPLRASVNDVVQLADSDVVGGTLTVASLDDICDRIEYLRSQSIAVRNADIIGHVRNAALQLGGTISGAGPFRRVQVILPRGKTVLAYPAVGVPTANLLNAVADHAGGQEAAIVFDRLGIQEEWLGHLAWLGEHVPEVRWIQTSEVAWRFIEWDGER